jgi:spermidine/putrescine-binding protein
MRRRLLVLAGVVAMIAAACGGGGGGDALQEAIDACEPGQTDGDLNLYNWSEYIDPDLIEAFKTEHGVNVVETFYDSNETALAQLEAGGAPYDLIVPSDYMVSTMVEAELLAKLNKDALPNLANIDAAFASGLPFDPDAEYTAPYQWGTTGIGFSYEFVDAEDGISWGIIFDPEMTSEYAGRISLLNDERETLGAALKYLGYSVNSTSEAEIQEASDLIKATKDRIATFDSDAYDDLLVTGQTVVAHGWNGGFFSSFDAGDLWDDFGYLIPNEGGVVWVDNMAVPVTAEHPCTAHTFIDFILDAENGAALTNWTYYASPNQAAEEFILPEILEDPAIYPPQEMLDDGSLEFIADVGDMATTYADAFVEAKS